MLCNVELFKIYVHGICKKAFLYIKLCRRAMIM